MKDRHTVRGLLALPVLGGLGAFLAWGLSGLPPFGEFHGAYGLLLDAIAVPQRHTTNVVTAIVFDYRGFDTLGEELILFVAALGTTVLLRAQRSEEAVERAAEDEQRRGPETSGALRALRAVLVGPMLLLGIYVVVHGALTAGGGFQGGVILAGALLLVYAAGQVAAVQRVRPVALVEVADAVGAGVDPTRVGQRVWIWEAAWNRPEGTAQEYVVVPERQAVPLPAGASFDLGAVGAKGEVSSAAFVNTVDDFYLTNPIARASVTLAECSTLAASRRATSIAAE